MSLPRRYILSWSWGLTVSGSLAALSAHAGVITGQVTDAEQTRTLPGTEVTLLELNRTTVVGEDGSFRFVDVAAGSYTLRASYAGATTLQQSVTVASADATVTEELRLQAASDLEEVLVVGQRANLASSISRQRSADTVQNVLTRDSIGQFPDQNVAESVRRVAGVNVIDDQGEGRFIAVRGMNPDLNAASINGVRVPAPEADVRSVALDVIPSELIESIEIKKTLTPDMDADTIGASIDIKTTSALDRRDPFLSFTTEASYNDLRAAWSPKASLDFSRQLTDRFGVAGGVSYYKRKFSTDNIEMDGWNITDDGVVYAEEVQYRDYDVERKRLGVSLSLDFKASDNTRLYARTLWSDFDDQEYRARLTFKLSEEPSSGDANTAAFSSDDGRIRVERDLKDRFEGQTIKSFALGGDTDAGPWSFNYKVSYSKADEQEHGSLDPTKFRHDFKEAGELAVTFDYSDITDIGYQVTTGAAVFLDPSEYAFNKLERTTLSLSEDEETSAKFDVVREFALDAGSFDLQAGAKLRRRQKTYDKQVDFFENYDDFTLADVLGSASYGLADIDPVASPSAIRSWVSNNIGLLEYNAVDSAFDSSVEDYDVKEDIDAAYLSGKYSNDVLRVIAGVRMERTHNDIRGNLVELVEDTVFVTPQHLTRAYTNWLPSLNVRYEPVMDVVLRAGVYSSVVRPGVGKLAPRFQVEESDDGYREGEFGNPDLRPYEALNFDASAEWYFADNASLQAGVFHKQVDNFIVDAEFEDIEVNGIVANEVVMPINGEAATVTGLELGYQQALTGLPSPFDGLVLGANYTYTDSEGEVDGRKIPLPMTSENTWNATLGYEKGAWSVRLAAAYRDLYLDELGSDAGSDRYVKSHLQWDFSAKYKITETLRVFAELVNITNEPYLAYQRGPNGDRLLQYEEYSWTGMLGLRASF